MRVILPSLFYVQASRNFRSLGQQKIEPVRIAEIAGHVTQRDAFAGADEFSAIRWIDIFDPSDPCNRTLGEGRHTRRDLGRCQPVVQGTYARKGRDVAA